MIRIEILLVEDKSFNPIGGFVSLVLYQPYHLIKIKGLNWSQPYWLYKLGS